MTNLIKNSFGGDYRPFYIGIAVLIVVICLVVGFGIKDTPEEAGLYPDGADHAPKSETNDEINLTVAQLLKQKKLGYLLYPLAHFSLSSMHAWAPWLSVTSPLVVRICGLVRLLNGLVLVPYLVFRCLMYSVFLDDKFGSVKASIILGLCEFIPVLCLMLQDGTSTGLRIGWGAVLPA